MSSDKYEPAFLQNILDSMGEGVMVLDKEFKVTKINKSAEKITGYKEKEVLGKFCKYVFRSNLCYEECPLALTLKRGESIVDYEVEIFTKNDNQKIIQANTAVIHSDKKEPVGGIITFREKDSLRILSDKILSMGDFDGMIGRHPSMIKIFDLIKKVSTSDFNVLITGESGTGKEMVADAIQSRSDRNEEAYIKVNCSAFPETLLSSELFGHVKGAFTDASSNRVGRFELADKGTIFLDEIGEVSPILQLKLLRVLQDGSFERVGESLTKYADVRVIAATNRNLEEAMKSGDFREDLFYRLNVIPIHIPPLRERKTDIPDLVRYFIKKYNILTQKNITRIEKDTFHVLQDYDWPGNIRQLENAVEYAFAISTSNKITMHDLPMQISSATERLHTVKKEIPPLQSEKEIILSALEEHKWSKSHTASALGISRSSLWRKIKKYHLS